MLLHVLSTAAPVTGLVLVTMLPVEALDVLTRRALRRPLHDAPWLRVPR